MRLDQGPGPGFVLLVTALTVGAAWSAAQTKPLAPEVPERLQSQPVKAKPGTGPGFVVVDEQRPDGRAALQATDYAAEALPIPGLSALSGDPLRFALDALNGTVAPCEPCWTAGRTLADCLLTPPERCERLPVWTERAVRLAGEGQTPPQIRDQIHFNDAWFPAPTLALPGAPLQGAELPVWVAVDYGSPFTREAEPVWAALQAQQGEALALAWLMAPRAELASKAAAQAALVAAERGCFPAVHAALLAEDSAAFRGDLPPTQALARAFEAADCGAPPNPEEGAQALAAHLKLAESLGVRGTPTAFVAGHRVRGLRDPDTYARILSAEQEESP